MNGPQIPNKRTDRKHFGWRCDKTQHLSIHTWSQAGAEVQGLGQFNFTAHNQARWQLSCKIYGYQFMPTAVNV
jgi:hypothetical protein